MRLSFVALLGLMVACASNSGTTYSVDKVAATAPQLRVTQVVVAKKSTRVSFRYDAGDRTRRVGIHAVGQPGAFAITDPATGQRYALRKIKGIAVAPERTDITPGASLTFTLTFDPIPAGTKRIHVGEGEYSAEAGESRWTVRNVELR